MVLKCSIEAYAICPYRAHCGTCADAVFAPGSECAQFNEMVERMTTPKGKELIYKDEARAAVLHENPAIAFCIDRIKPVDAAPMRSGRWIPVTERLPENGKMVLCWGVYGHDVMHWDDVQGIWICDKRIFPQSWVMCWMPLPEPPKEVKT